MRVAWRGRQGNRSSREPFPNATALAALRAFKEGASPEAVIEQLREAFDADPEADVARDVYDLVSRLREHGLVR